MKGSFTSLSRYRVLDLSSEMGAFCGKLLGNFGMDVVRVEPPGGDPLRRSRPLPPGVFILKGAYGLLISTRGNEASPWI